MNKEILETLPLAIAETGIWTWWAAKFPDAFQIEFDRTRLFLTKQRQGIVPSGKFAMRFINPVSVSFLEFGPGLEANWFQKFHEDQLGPFQMSPGKMFFDKEKVKALVKTSKKENRAHGCDPLDPEFNKAKVIMAFTAGNAGLAVAAESFGALNQFGGIDMELLPAFHEKWWSYCEEYWEMKGTKKELPHDPVCELTPKPVE